MATRANKNDLINNLPADIWSTIFHHLNVEDVINVCVAIPSAAGGAHLCNFRLNLCKPSCSFVQFAQLPLAWTTIQTLDFTFCEAKGIAKIIKRAINLTTLRVVNSNITFEEICTAISDLRKLEELHMTVCDMDTVSKSEFSESVASSLLKLHINLVIEDIEKVYPYLLFALRCHGLTHLTINDAHEQAPEKYQGCPFCSLKKDDVVSKRVIWSNLKMLRIFCVSTSFHRLMIEIFTCQRCKFVSQFPSSLKGSVGRYHLGIGYALELNTMTGKYTEHDPIASSQVGTSHIYYSTVDNRDSECMSDVIMVNYDWNTELVPKSPALQLFAGPTMINITELHINTVVVDNFPDELIIRKALSSMLKLRKLICNICIVEYLINNSISLPLLTDLIVDDDEDRGGCVGHSYPDKLPTTNLFPRLSAITTVFYVNEDHLKYLFKLSSVRYVYLTRTNCPGSGYLTFPIHDVIKWITAGNIKVLQVDMVDVTFEMALLNNIRDLQSLRFVSLYDIMITEPTCAEIANQANEVASQLPHLAQFCVDFYDNTESPEVVNKIDRLFINSSVMFLYKRRAFGMFRPYYYDILKTC